MAKKKEVVPPATPLAAKETKKPGGCGGGCGKLIAYGVLGIFALAFIGSLLPKSPTQIAATETAAAAALLPTVAVLPTLESTIVNPSVSPESPISFSTPQATSTSTDTSIIASSPTLAPTLDSPMSLGGVPSSTPAAPTATITDTPSIPTATITDTPLPSPTIVPTTEFTSYLIDLQNDIAGKTPLLSMTVDSSTNSLIVTYTTTQQDSAAQNDEMINIFNAIGFYMYLNNYKWDISRQIETITLVKTLGEQKSTVVATIKDTINFAASPNRYPRSSFEQTLQTSGTAPTNTSTSVMGVAEKTYYAEGSVNVRSCAQKSCSLVIALNKGDAVTVTGLIDGDEVNAGNKIWYQVKVNGLTGFVYSDLVNTVKPDTGSNTTVTTNNNQSVVPVQSVPTVQQAACPSNCTEAKAMGLTAEQAAACGLDRDGDGKACYGD